MKPGKSDILLPLAWIGAAILLFLFSYTQVDLSLTLSRLSIYQTIEKTFQHIGYYQRPLATGLFVALVALFAVLYEWTLVAVKRGTLSLHGLWRIIIGIVIVLIFSYPAFSYDIFNYMFDAKTVLVYHKIPYLIFPLQLSGVEPWLSFMRWTHIPTPYMPFWITITLPVYLMGFGYFLTILWSFKAFIAIAYIVTAWFIWKILHTMEEPCASYGMALFALNPLVIFEILVSGHNDMAMLVFAVISFYLYLQKKRLASFVFLAISAATKGITGALLPLYIMGWQRKWSLVFTLLGFIFFIAVTKREILAWYFIWFIPWYALLPKQNWLKVIGTAASVGCLLSYVPYLYQGDYNPPVITLKFVFMTVPIVLALMWVSVPYLFHVRRSRA